MKANLILLAQGLLMLWVSVAPYIENGFVDLSLLPFRGHKVIGIAFQVIGVILLIASVKTMKENFEVRAKQRSSSELVTDWPFSWVRNPTYFAGIIMSFGWSLSQLSIYGFIGSVLLTIVLNIKIRMEEMYLREQFGAAYDDYLKKVPKLLPKFK